jgi:hypothetical protein
MQRVHIQIAAPRIIRSVDYAAKRTHAATVRPRNTSGAFFSIPKRIVVPGGVHALSIKLRYEAFLKVRTSAYLI